MYDIIAATDINDLDLQVNKMMQQGWLPQGSLVLVPEGLRHMLEGSYFMQPMIKVTPQ